MTFRMAASIDVGLYRVLRLEAATPLAEMVEALNRYQPEFLHAYGSVLGLLAAEQLDGRLRIGPRPSPARARPTPTSCATPSGPPGGQLV
jgi:hypothetical protein